MEEDKNSSKKLLELRTSISEKKNVVVKENDLTTIENEISKISDINFINSSIKIMDESQNYNQYIREPVSKFIKKITEYLFKRKGDLSTNKSSRFSNSSTEKIIKPSNTLTKTQNQMTDKNKNYSTISKIVSSAPTSILTSTSTKMTMAEKQKQMFQATNKQIQEKKNIGKEEQNKESHNVKYDDKQQGIDLYGEGEDKINIDDIDKNEQNQILENIKLQQIQNKGAFANVEDLTVQAIFQSKDLSQNEGKDEEISLLNKKTENPQNTKTTNAQNFPRPQTTALSSKLFTQQVSNSKSNKTPSYSLVTTTSKPPKEKNNSDQTKFLPDKKETFEKNVESKEEFEKIEQQLVKMLKSSPDLTNMMQGEKTIKLLTNDSGARFFRLIALSQSYVMHRSLVRGREESFMEKKKLDVLILPPLFPSFVQDTNKGDRGNDYEKRFIRMGGNTVLLDNAPTTESFTRQYFFSGYENITKKETPWATLCNSDIVYKNPPPENFENDPELEPENLPMNFTTNDQFYTNDPLVFSKRLEFDMRGIVESSKIEIFSSEYRIGEQNVDFYHPPALFSEDKLRADVLDPTKLFDGREESHRQTAEWRKTGENNKDSKVIESWLDHLLFDMMAEKTNSKERNENLSVLVVPLPHLVFENKENKDYLVYSKFIWDILHLLMKIPLIRFEKLNKQSGKKEEKEYLPIWYLPEDDFFGKNDYEKAQSKPEPQFQPWKNLRLTKILPLFCALRDTKTLKETFKSIKSYPTEDFRCEYNDYFIHQACQFLTGSKNKKAYVSAPIFPLSGAIERPLPILDSQIQYASRKDQTRTLLNIERLKASYYDYLKPFLLDSMIVASDADKKKYVDGGKYYTIKKTLFESSLDKIPNPPKETSEMLSPDNKGKKRKSNRISKKEMASLNIPFIDNTTKITQVQASQTPLQGKKVPKTKKTKTPIGGDTAEKSAPIPKNVEVINLEEQEISTPAKTSSKTGEKFSKIDNNPDNRNMDQIAVGTPLNTAEMSLLNMAKTTTTTTKTTTSANSINNPTAQKLNEKGTSKKNEKDIFTFISDDLNRRRSNETSSNSYKKSTTLDNTSKLSQPKTGYNEQMDWD